MTDHSRRNLAFVATVAAVGAGALLSGRKAVAQQSKSTWEQIQETKTLRMAAPISEPFCFKDLTNSDKPGGVKVGDVTWRGVSVNVCKELAEALGVQLQLVETTFGNAVAGLQANQFDLMISLDGNVKRAVAVDFVPQGLFMYGTAILARTGADIATWKAINDKKLHVAATVGSSNEADVVHRAPDAKIERFQNINEMIAAFQAGRVDALSQSLTGVTLQSARIPGTIVAMPTPAVLYPVTAGIRYESDPRWRNFLTTSFSYLANSGFVQKTLDEAYAYRGVDISKLQPVVTR